jgi:hypothetical protein
MQRIERLRNYTHKAPIKVFLYLKKIGCNYHNHNLLHTIRNQVWIYYLLEYSFPILEIAPKISQTEYFSFGTY